MKRSDFDRILECLEEKLNLVDLIFSHLETKNEKEAIKAIENKRQVNEVLVLIRCLRELLCKGSDKDALAFLAMATGIALFNKNFLPICSHEYQQKMLAWEKSVKSRMKDGASHFDWSPGRERAEAIHEAHPGWSRYRVAKKIEEEKVVTNERNRHPSLKAISMHIASIVPTRKAKK